MDTGRSDDDRSAECASDAEYNKPCRLAATLPTFHYAYAYLDFPLSPEVRKEYSMFYQTIKISDSPTEVENYIEIYEVGILVHLGTWLCHQAIIGDTPGCVTFGSNDTSPCSFNSGRFVTKYLLDLNDQ